LKDIEVAKLIMDEIHEQLNNPVACLLTAPGNVQDHVVIERESESTVVFVEGAKDAYLGYCTLKVSISVCQTLPG